MKAELQFFMIDSDKAEFLDFAQQHIDRIEDDTHFIIGDCEILFTPSVLIDDTLLMGKIAINSGGVDDGLKDQTRANNAYRQLRNWFKKNYYGRLSTWTEGKEEKLSRSRNLWLGLGAKKWKEENPDTTMKLSKEGSIIFGIAPETHAIGKIVPTNKKFQLKKSFL